jgi:hypothetical protein
LSKFGPAGVESVEQQFVPAESSDLAVVAQRGRGLVETAEYRLAAAVDVYQHEFFVHGHVRRMNGPTHDDAPCPERRFHLQMDLEQADNWMNV